MDANDTTPAPGKVAGLLILTAATGALDAVSFLGLGRVFTGNMTGNVLFISMGLAGDQSISILNNSVALTAFVAGATIGARVVSPSGPDGRPSVGAVRLLTMNTVIVASIDVYWLAAGTLPGSMMLATAGALAAILGAQAATVMRIGSRDLSTIVLTMTLVRLAVDSHLAGGSGKEWQARLLAVACLSFGALVAGFFTLRVGGWLGLVPAVALMAVGTTVLATQRQRQGQGRPSKR